jgi:tRNA1Val (adenine37-N6)-methyltransferase
MSNNYFQFKQFTIQQDKCAMKVCTDACLFGAWVAQELQQHTCFDILDIGTGTGLLSLMLAQKTSAAIDAVEIDQEAYEQAAANVQLSQFCKYIKVFHSSITNFNPDYKYDCIISNPPFFEADLKSTQQNKNDAKHDTSLTLAALCARARELLKDDGYFAVLLPHHRTDYFVTESLQHGFYCSKKISVKQTPNHNYFRSMLLLSPQKTGAEEKEIIIKDTPENYSNAFTQLLKDYYLYL